VEVHGIDSENQNDVDCSSEKNIASQDSEPKPLGAAGTMSKNSREENHVRTNSTAIQPNWLPDGYEAHI